MLIFVVVAVKVVDVVEVVTVVELDVEFESEIEMIFMISLSSAFAVRKGFIFLSWQDGIRIPQEFLSEKKADDVGILLEFDFHFFGIAIF